MEAILILPAPGKISFRFCSVSDTLLKLRMENLFAYGSLMCDDIMSQVSGFRVPSLHGTLKGYRRLSIKDEYYPAIIPDDQSGVEGVVYMNLPPVAWQRLDKYEGGMYTCSLVRIELDGGEISAAATYVLRPEFRDKLDHSCWSFSDFLKNKENFEKKHRSDLTAIGINGETNVSPGGT